MRCLLFTQWFPRLYWWSNQLGDVPSQATANELCWLQSLLIPRGACDHGGLSLPYSSSIRLDCARSGHCSPLYIHCLLHAPSSDGCTESTVQYETRSFLPHSSDAFPFNYTLTFELALKKITAPFTLRQQENAGTNIAGREKKTQGHMGRHSYVFEVRPKHSYKEAQTVFKYHVWRWNDIVTEGMKGDSASLFLSI